MSRHTTNNFRIVGPRHETRGPAKKILPLSKMGAMPAASHKGHSARYGSAEITSRFDTPKTTHGRANANGLANLQITNRRLRGFPVSPPGPTRGRQVLQRADWTLCSAGATASERQDADLTAEPSPSARSRVNCRRHFAHQRFDAGTAGAPSATQLFRPPRTAISSRHVLSSKAPYRCPCKGNRAISGASDFCDMVK